MPASPASTCSIPPTKWCNCAVLGVVLAATALVLTGCGGPDRVGLQVQGLEPLNVNEQHESTPVDVRFYQLRSDARFRAATVEQLWTDDKKVLDSDLVTDPTTATIYPAAPGVSPVMVTLDVADATKFIGVLALFHKADAEDHRMLVVPLDEAKHEILTLTGFAVSIHAADASGGRSK